MRPLRVFLCHASQDKPTVWKLHRYLKQHGIKPWLDREDLLPGEDWEVEIPKALFASDVILVCLSKNSVNKEGFVQKEITFALDKAMEKPEGTIFIIPVKLEDCEIPRRLTRYQWVDLSRPEGRKRLLMGLNKRVTELGFDVSPLILDDTRRTTQPKTLKPEVKKPEEPIVFVPVKEEIEEPRKEIPAQASTPSLKEERPVVKFTQKKPFTKLLDPSLLNPQSDEKVVARKTKPVQIVNFRLLGIGGIILLVLVFGGFGLNYLINNLPLPTATPSPTDTVTPKPPSFTSVPFTSTPQPIITLILTPTKIPSPTPTPSIGSTMVSEKDGMTLLYVPAGEFKMGSNAGNRDEGPVHQVYLNAFWIDQTEVTNQMYAKCITAQKCTAPNDHASRYSDTRYANYPVINVSWNVALAYCSWANRRLPTEAEWEKAASWDELRHEKYIYPWGNYFRDTFANFCDINCNAGGADKKYNDGYGGIAPVKSYPNGISPYGIYDMAGNVWEWVSSLYKPYPYEANDGREDLNALGLRMFRGGSWSSGWNSVPGSTVRYGRNDPTYDSNDLGFRCARSP